MLCVLCFVRLAYLAIGGVYVLIKKGWCVLLMRLWGSTNRIMYVVLQPWLMETKRVYFVPLDGHGSHQMHTFVVNVAACSAIAKP